MSHTQTPQDKPSFAPRQQTGDSIRKTAIILAGNRLRRALIIASVAGVAGVFMLLLSGNTGDISLQLDTPQGQLTAEQVLLPHRALKGITYKGYTDEGTSYIVFADQVQEAPEDSTIIHLTSPRTRINTSEGETMTIRSNHAEYSIETQTIVLNGRVVIVRPDIGYTLHTAALTADLATGDVTGNTNVRGYARGGTIRAEGMTIHDQGEHIIFTGKTAVTLNDVE